MATDDRIIPLASIRLFDPGQGDPQMSDRGWGWWSILQAEGHLGTVSISSGERTLEVLENVGLTNRPQMVLQDTRLTNFTVNSGSWEERRPSSGIRKYRLVQYDTTADLQWWVQSKYSLPANPHVIFEFVFIDSPPDHNFTTFPPFVRLEFGGGLWSIEFSKQEGARLRRYIAGSWETAMDINEPVSLANMDNGAKTVILRHLRGRIFISTDFGNTYQSFGFDDGSGTPVTSSKFNLTGQGGMVVFGVHQLKYNAGTYDSPTRSTFTSRTILATPTIQGRTNLPGTTSITYSDQSTPGSGIAKYRATLTPQTITGTPFNFYQAPELYAVKFKYPVIRFAALGGYTTPWDGDVLEIDIDKPLGLDSTTASVRVFRDASTQYTESALRWRKVGILLGDYRDGGASVLTGTFVGYIRQVRIPQNEHNKSRIELEIDPGSTPPKRQEFDDFATPLGGQTCNQALDEVLDSMGFVAADRNWHFQGDLVSLPAGSPEDPFMWPKAGENKWDIMTRIAKHAGMEIFRADDGIWSSVPLDYVDPFVSHVYDSAPTGDATYSIQGAAFGVDVSESATCVIARGKDEFGNAIWAFGVDTDAENNPASPRFCPWRETVSIDVQGTSTVGYLVRVVQSWFITHVGLKFEADISVPAKLEVLRRQRVRVEDTTIGINNFDEFAVMSLRHQYRPTISGCRTTAGLRRIGV